MQFQHVGTGLESAEEHSLPKNTYIYNDEKKLVGNPNLMRVGSLFHEMLQCFYIEF